MASPLSDALWRITLDVPSSDDRVDLATCRGKPPISYFKDKTIGHRVFISNLFLPQILPAFLHHPGNFVVLCRNAYFYISSCGLKSEFVEPGSGPDYGFLNTVAQMLCVRTKFHAGYEFFIQSLTDQLKHFDPYLPEDTIVGSSPATGAPMAPTPLTSLPPTPPPSLVDETFQQPAVSASSSAGMEEAALELMVKNGPGHAIRHSPDMTPSHAGSRVSPTMTWPTPTPSKPLTLFPRPSTAVPTRQNQNWDLRKNATPRNLPAAVDTSPSFTLGQRKEGDMEVKQSIWDASDREEPPSKGQRGRLRTARSTGRLKPSRPIMTSEAKSNGRRGWWGLFRSPKPVEEQGGQVVNVF